MKKGKLVGLVLAVIFLGIIIGGYLVIDGLFPLAKPINCPSAESIVSIQISSDDNEYIEMVDSYVEKLLMYISNAKPTREMSVNDHPYVRPYYEIVMKTNEKTFRCYVYREGNNAYVELPYEGIYTTDISIVEIIAEMFDER